MRCSAAQPHTHGMTTLSARAPVPGSAEHEVRLRGWNPRALPAARRCRSRRAVPRRCGDARATLFAPRRLVCRDCGLSRVSTASRVTFSRGTAQPATDPYFGTPLWLQRDRHGWLWAYNLDHLDLLQRFVQAPLRERAPWYDTRRKMTLVARLPLWIKRAGNRERNPARYRPDPCLADFRLIGTGRPGTPNSTVLLRVGIGT